MGFEFETGVSTYRLTNGANGCIIKIISRRLTTNDSKLLQIERYNLHSTTRARVES